MARTAWAPLLQSQRALLVTITHERDAAFYYSVLLTQYYSGYTDNGTLTRPAGASRLVTAFGRVGAPRARLAWYGYWVQTYPMEGVHAAQLVWKQGRGKKKKRLAEIQMRRPL